MTTLPAFIAAALLSSLACAAPATERVSVENYGGRSMIVYVPSRLPPPGARALVIVLHGGMGNARRIAAAQSESGLNMNSLAEEYGFVVAYLNGTRVARRLGPNRLGWNAGGCCGLPAANNIDDVGYIQGAVDTLVAKYAIDRSRVYGMGHSNGAMMTQRLLCETHLYAAGVPISGPLNLDTENCPGARGNRILAIHGADDANVPIAGGRGTRGISNAVYNSEDRTRLVFTHAGASYDLEVVKGADHKLEHIDAAIQQSEGQSIAEKAAKFFGLVIEHRQSPSTTQ